MKTVEEKAKECIDNLIDSLSLEVNHEESNYDAGQTHALVNYGKEIYEVGFSEGQSNPKIKQLEWDFYGAYYSAETSVGRYEILQGDEQYLENYITCSLTYNGSLIADFNSIKEAKASAQADFERRVMECLDLKAQQKQALIDMMRGDEELGLYDDNPKNHGYER